MVKVGCCGFPTSRARYFQSFRLVEVQQTFYHPPTLATAERWRREALSDFEFSLKAWQLITHEAGSPTYRRLRLPIAEERRGNYGSFKLTDEVMDAWKTTREIARALKAKVIVFQCPARFGPVRENKDNLRRFFRSIDRGEFLMAWEPRGEWRREEIEELCWDLNLIYCIDPFKESPLGGRTQYFRLHGKTGYRYRFTQNDLLWLKGICLEGVTNYVLFNNVSMYDDAMRFKELICKG